MKKIEDLTGQRFGRLMVISKTTSNKYRQSMWLCRCDCGTEKTILGLSLKHGKTTSCGCRNREVASERFTTHGHTRGGRTLEYQSWLAMIRRCNNPNEAIYHYYGGRGIKVCERWVNSYENFLEDMGKRPSKNHSLERIDVDGDYEPSNCKWATRTEQALNKRLYKNNISGKSGVVWNKERKKWQARINYDGKEIHIGLYDNIEDAIYARKEAEIKYYNTH